jgi:hypothetical protein
MQTRDHTDVIGAGSVNGMPNFSLMASGLVNAGGFARRLRPVKILGHRAFTLIARKR